MEYISYRKQVSQRILDRELAALEAMGQFVNQKAHDRCPVKGGTSADGVYVSDSQPTKNSGAVRRTIKHSIDRQNKRVVVGTNHMLAPGLEKGTSREQAHPFLTPAAEENITQIARIGEEKMRL